MGHSSSSSAQKHQATKSSGSVSSKRGFSESAPTLSEDVQPPSNINSCSSSSSKTPYARCVEIGDELKLLERDIDAFAGGPRNDKLYLKLDEMLTRSVLKLDEIARGDDERVNEMRKELVNYAHKLSDRLESKVDEQACRQDIHQHSVAAIAATSDHS